MALSERQALTLWQRTIVASVRCESPDLTARQQAILMTVSLTRGPHTVRGLAESLNIAKPAVTRALDALAKADLVKRVKDEADLRNVFIERTQAGLAYLRQLAGFILAAEKGGTGPQKRDDKSAAA